MSYRINFIIQHISELCEEIVTVSNNTAYSDDYLSALNKQLSENKDVLGLVNYCFYTPPIDWCYSFVVSFYFKYLDEKYEVEFVNTNPKSLYPRYKAKLISPKLLISSKPVFFPVEGIVCCEECQRILYVNPFSSYFPKSISFQNLFLIDGEKRINTDKRRLVDFTEKLTLLEKQHIKIANASFLEDPSMENDYNEYFYLLEEGIQWLKDIVDTSLTSCIVVQDEETNAILKSMLPTSLHIIGYEDIIPILTREEWIHRAILMIIEEFAFVANKSKYINDSIALFMNHYHCSKSFIIEICKDIMNDSDFESLRKRLSYPLM